MLSSRFSIPVSIPAFALSILTGTGVSAQIPTLVADLDARTLGDAGMTPTGLVRFAGAVYFAASSREYGRELYRSTGGPAQLVADVVPGVAGSHPSQLTVVGNRLAFVVNMFDLWITDGTSAGTVRLRKFDDTAGVNPNYLTAAGNRLFFMVGKAQGRSDLWVSDGTVNGTRLVRRAIAEQLPMQGVGNVMYFAGGTSGNGAELWKSDGTPAGTVAVNVILPGPSGSRPHDMVAYGNRLVFSATGPSGPALWISDGTPAGTMQLLDKTGLGNPTAFFKGAGLGGLVYFGTQETAGGALWVTGGTPTTTRRVATTVGPVFGLRRFRGHVYFSSAKTLWRSDGTAIGTRTVHSSTWPVAVLGDSGTHVFFKSGYAISGGRNDFLFATDGTAAGTVQLSANPLNLGDAFVAAAAGTVLFSANRQNSPYELWKSDGTPAGTKIAYDYQPPKRFTRSSFADATIDLGDLACGTIVTDTNDYGSFRSDGTTAGTARIMPGNTTRPLASTLDGAVFLAQRGKGLLRVDPVTLQSTTLFPGDPLGVYRLGDHHYVVANDVNRRGGVWRTDGTPSGTTLVKSLSPAVFALGDHVVFKGAIYVGVSHLGGSRLWRIDGTPTGTFEMIAAGPSPWDGAYGVYGFGDHLMVSTGSGVLRSSGQVAGSTLLTASTWRGEPAVIGGVMYFLSKSLLDPTLWRTDATTAGTTVVKRIRTGVADYYFGPSLFQHRGGLYFYASDGIHGLELWRSDGTANGTVLLKDIRRGARGTDHVSRHAMVSGDRYLYFAAKDEAHGHELWRTDGTSAGTLLVHDLNPGPADANPSNLRVRRGELWFTADNGVVGAELWRLDIGANSHPVGHGCAGSGRPPVLSATPPRLGSTLTIDLTGIAMSARVAVLALGVRISRPIYLGTGCSLFVDFAAPVVIQTLAPRNGSVRLGVAVPSTPGLHGTLLPMQAAAGPTGNTPLGLDLSNALYLAFRR